ncbi:hypothetical protein ACEWY4_003903 [Coilia grayii]|uniref:MADF domain-containing protein n=1 Tax=Coilia grayii TaxID=363190 RepID=A0ABD1KK02_9TELE
MGDRLINLVSQHPVLYDKSRDDYIDTKMKDIWAGIAHELQNSVSKVQMQWKNLVDTYRKCRKDVGVSGQAGGQKKKKWKHFDAMSFIDYAKEHRRVSSNISIGEADEAEVGEEAEVESQDDQSPNPPKRRRQTPAKMSFLENYLQRKEEREQERERERFEEKDHVHQFLSSLAPAMRRLTEENQSYARMKFQQVLHELEFGQRASGPPVPIFDGHTHPHYSGDQLSRSYMNL